MTGPEHYAEAERLINNAGGVPSSVDVSEILAAAQVHATLALTAATVLDHTPATAMQHAPLWREAIT